MSHMTRTPLSRSKGQRSRSQGSGHIVAASRLQLVVFCLLVVLARLPVPVQVVDWKDSSPK